MIVPKKLETSNLENLKPEFTTWHERAEIQEPTNTRTDLWQLFLIFMTIVLKKNSKTWFWYITRGSQKNLNKELATKTAGLLWILSWKPQVLQVLWNIAGIGRSLILIKCSKNWWLWKIQITAQHWLEPNAWMHEWDDDA